MMVNRRSPEPFKICSSRPLTDNFSLTFRLTIRDSYRDKFAFGPGHRRYTPFSKSSCSEKIDDIHSTVRMKTRVTAAGIGGGGTGLICDNICRLKASICRFYKNGCPNRAWGL